MATAAFQNVIPSIIPFRTPQTIHSLLERVLGISEIEDIYKALRSMGSESSIAERLLQFLSISYTASEVDLARIPKTGAAIVTVNHPFGILEGAVLVSLLQRIRPDVRFLANGILTAIPEIRDFIIPVDPISGRSAVSANGRALRRSIEHLRDGALLVVFPAGEVSHFQWKDRAVTDGEWNPTVARIADIAGVPVVPAYVAGGNGALFQIAGMLHPGLRTALLGRELLNKSGRAVEVRIGAPIAPAKLHAISTPREQAEYLRWRTYLLASREQFKARTALPLARGDSRQAAIAPTAAPVDAQVLAAEIGGLPDDCILGRSGDLAVYLAGASQIPGVLQELGRLREITFRAAGEGTGRALDIDEFDSRYLHLFLWNARKQELAGAYRLACTDTVRRQHGAPGLYTASLFQYGEAFLDRLGPAIELGRSFVRTEYQKGFAPLLLLWKGIGAFVARHPRYKILFGAVSISNRYEAASRELMVSFLEKYALLADWAGLIRNRSVFPDRILKGPRRPVLPDGAFDVEDLSAAVNDIEQKPGGIPVLLRQYLRLGGKLLGFHVDPDFAHTLDGLILVDLTRTEPKLLERYLGKREAAQFLDFQKGQNGTL
ncbi:MAG TPA: GNAT family N-acyltransferase [Bryobacteraceae bacterium]|nr:GNAT family N-acyltransferase [Bryobacteraceae bacterium]